jgi:hypothetical protein
MEVCYCYSSNFTPFADVSVQLANKRGLKKIVSAASANCGVKTKHSRLKRKENHEDFFMPY